MYRSPALRYARANLGLTFRPDANCVLWLPGQDDPQSSTIRDRSGNGNNGTFGAGAAAPTWKRLPSGLWVLDFDGLNDHTLISYHASLNPKLITIEIWFKAATNLPDFARLINDIDFPRQLPLTIACLMPLSRGRILRVERS